MNTTNGRYARAVILIFLVQGLFYDCVIVKLKLVCMKMAKHFRTLFRVIRGGRGCEQRISSFVQMVDNLQWLAFTVLPLVLKLKKKKPRPFLILHIIKTGSMDSSLGAADVNKATKRSTSVQSCDIHVT